MNQIPVIEENIENIKTLVSCIKMKWIRNEDGILSSPPNMNEIFVSSSCWTGRCLERNPEN
jgi:hypothetical protein